MRAVLGELSQYWQVWYQWRIWERCCFTWQLFLRGVQRNHRELHHMAQGQLPEAQNQQNQPVCGVPIWNVSSLAEKQKQSNSFHVFMSLANKAPESPLLYPTSFEVCCWITAREIMLQVVVICIIWPLDINLASHLIMSDVWHFHTVSQIDINKM